MGTHNICFYGELSKIVLQLSLNTLFICSSDQTARCSNFRIITAMISGVPICIVFTLIKNYHNVPNFLDRQI